MHVIDKYTRRVENTLWSRSMVAASNTMQANSCMDGAKDLFIELRATNQKGGNPTALGPNSPGAYWGAAVL